MAWAKKETSAVATTKHSHGANFGKHVDDCPRCAEIKSGTGTPVVKWNMSAAKRSDAQRSLEIRNHDCKASRCGVVCTAFEW